MISSGKGILRVTLNYSHIGDDLLAIITGGKEHIGVVTLLDKGSYLTFGKNGHKESIITEQTASMIYEYFKKDILVICGIHIDNATSDEINILVENSKRCVEIFLKEYNV